MTAVRAPGAVDRAERALNAIAAGRPVVLVDEDMGHLVIAAEAADTRQVAFFVRHTSGLLCVALTGADSDRLNLPPMHHAEAGPHAEFRVTVDTAHGTGTGISAEDRGRTIRALAATTSGPDTFTRPGHVLPLRGDEGGVLARRGRTEAALDLARLAGRRPAALLAGIVSAIDGGLTMAQPPELTRFAAKHDFALVSVTDLTTFRIITETTGW